MTATDEKITSRGDYSNGISIETSKVIQGMSLVFAGATTMLEAIHPKISVQPAELMCLMTGDKEGLRQIAEMRKAEEAQEAEEAGETNDTVEEANEVENTDVGTVDAVPDDPVDDTADNDVPAVTDESPESPKAEEATTTTLTVDDITKVIVQKIKQNRSNNEKIGQVLKAYGAAKVSDLPASKYEAFLTDLSAI